MAFAVPVLFLAALLSFGFDTDPLKEEVASGKIAFRLTEPSEIREILGEPSSETERNDGGMALLIWSYVGVEVVFGRFRDDTGAPYTIRHLTVQGEVVDIGRDRKLVLRNNGDLAKLDDFQGFKGVSLVNVDLRAERELVDRMDFDSLTEWPPADKLPAGFDPAALLEAGKNPGLGLRELHKKGIDGTGVGIAIIDQPLLLGHQEYEGRIVRYDATGLAGFNPQMHASPVASIAVGKTAGVAPGATLSFFAVPMWEKDNAPYVSALVRIMELNQLLPAEERIRVVSISDGMFREKRNYERWRDTLRRAESAGVLVVTCDTRFMALGTLTLREGRDADDAASYVPGRYCRDEDVLRVPTGNKTIASHRGPIVYTFERDGGRSWAAPYVAGLAALAFQIDPDLRPDQIIEYLLSTATPTTSGPVVNPSGLVEAVLRRVDNRQD